MACTVEYYHAKVLGEIERWPVGVLADYAHLIELLTTFGPDLRMPHSRAMGGGLFELRAHGKEGLGRAFYCFVIGRRIIVLHAFIKKTQRSPQRELDIARRRRQEVNDA